MAIFEKERVSDAKQGFMPSVACVTCINEGRCTDLTLDGSMTYAMALGATMTVLAMLAF